MANKRDPYEVLGVSKTATDKEITKAFNKIQFQYHPNAPSNQGISDKKKEDNFQKLEEAREARDILSNQTLRKTYDDSGHAGVETFKKAGINPSVHAGPKKEYRPMNEEEMLNYFSGGNATTSKSGGSARTGINLTAEFKKIAEELASAMRLMTRVSPSFEKLEEFSKKLKFLQQETDRILDRNRKNGNNPKP